MTNDISNHETCVLNNKTLDKNISIKTCKNVLYGICAIGIGTSLLEIFCGLACVGGGLYALATETVLSLLSAEAILSIGIFFLHLGLFSMIKNLLGIKGADNPDKIIPALILGVIAMIFSGGNLVHVLSKSFDLFPLIIMVLTFALNAGFCFCTVMIHLANREAKKTKE